MSRRGMIFARASRTLCSTMDKLPKDRSAQQPDAGRVASFRSPPLWIHVSQAGKWLLSPREAKKRAVIRVLDRVNAVENRGQTPPVKTGL